MTVPPGRRFAASAPQGDQGILGRPGDSLTSAGRAEPRRRVAIAGASGRMGRTLIEAVAASADLVLAAAFDVPGSASVGSDAAAFLGRPSGVVVGADARAALAASEVLIDFTRPRGNARPPRALPRARRCRRHRHDRLRCGAESRDRGPCRAHRDRPGAQHERRRQRRPEAARRRGALARRRLRRRDRRDAPSHEGRRAERHGAAHGRGRRRRPRQVARERRRLRPRRRAPTRQHRLRVAARRRHRRRPHGALRRQPASGSRSRIDRPAAPPTPRAACARRASFCARKSGLFGMDEVLGLGSKTIAA